MPPPPSTASPNDIRRFAAMTLDLLERRIESAADEADLDLDLDRQDNVIEIEFDDGSVIVINSHSSAGEVWVAARSGGYHLSWTGSGADTDPPPATLLESWRDQRSGRALKELLDAEISAQAGAAVSL